MFSNKNEKVPGNLTRRLGRKGWKYKPSKCYLDYTSRSSKNGHSNSLSSLLRGDGGSHSLFQFLRTAPEKPSFSKRRKSGEAILSLLSIHFQKLVHSKILQYLLNEKHKNKNWIIQFLTVIDYSESNVLLYAHQRILRGPNIHKSYHISL